jgi:hypothetical protein
LNIRNQRYNLLREANEGYAKAVTLLNSAGGQPGAPGAAPLGPFLSELRALIGFFSLDPNRCVCVYLLVCVYVCVCTCVCVYTCVCTCVCV